MSGEEWGFADAIEQEEGFLLEDDFVPPEAEEPFIVSDSKPKNPLPQHASTLLALSLAEAAATDEPLQTAVLPHSEDVTVSSSPCVRRARLRSKTTVPPDSPFNVKPTPVSVEGKEPGEPSEKGDLG